MDSYTVPDYKSAALITIDVQCDTLDGQPLEIPGTSAMLPRLTALLGAARSRGMPIVHMVRIYKADGSNADVCRRAALEKGAALLLKGSAGCALAPELLPAPAVKLDPELLLAGGVQKIGDNEVVMYKPRWGAFFQTPLEAHLTQHSISTLIFAGCNYPNCPRTSIYEASERDYRIVLVTDAVSGLYGRGEIEMKNIGVWLSSANDVIRRLAQ